MSSLILYTTEDGVSGIQLRADGNTVWLTQREMAEPFGVGTDNIGLRHKNIYEDGELAREATTEESSVVQPKRTSHVSRRASPAATVSRSKPHYPASAIGGTSGAGVGYHVSLFFLRLPDAETAIARVATRVRQGGHDTPEDVIRRRFASGLRHFDAVYKAEVDDWALYDNAGDEPVLLDWSEKP